MMKKKSLISVLLLCSVIAMGQNDNRNETLRQGGEQVQQGQGSGVGGPGGNRGFNGFPGGPGGFAGGPWMMGSINQFGVEFHDDFLNESEDSKAIKAAMSNDSTKLYFAETQHFVGRVLIRFNNGGVSIDGRCPDGVDVKHSGGDVTVHIKGKAIELELSGTCNDGSIDIKSDSPVKIILNGLNLRSQKGEAVKINSSATAYMELADGRVNRLEDRYKEVDRDGRWSFMPRPVPTDYETEIIDGIEMRKSVNRAKVKDDSPKVGGVITSEGTLCFSGRGRLEMKGHNKNGIKSKGHIVFCPGNVINIEVTQGKGISAKGDIRIFGGVLNIDGSDSGDDCLRCDGSLYIDGGWTVVKASGGEASEGIEAKYNVEISSGTVEVASYDDAINSGGNLIVWGGKVFAASVINDALDSNSNLLISGGYVVALGGDVPECGLDANLEEGFSLYINGGTVFSTGGMPTLPSDKSRQNSIVCNVEQADSGMVFSLSTNMRNIQSIGLVRNYRRGCSMLFSSPYLKTGGNYEIVKSSNPSLVTDGFHNTSVQDADISGEQLESVNGLKGPSVMVGKTKMLFGPPMPPVQQ